MEESILKTKSYLFAVRIVGMVKFLQSEKKEYVLSKQCLNSGTAIGALIREARFAQSRRDFANKMSIALKEANETDFWLSLLHDTDYLEEKLFKSIIYDCNEIISMLVSSVKTSKKGKKGK